MSSDLLDDVLIRNICLMDTPFIVQSDSMFYNTENKTGEELHNSIENFILECENQKY